MIELMNNALINNEFSSSKGNQLKWIDNNIWYKADRNGYEGLSEYVISELLKKSNLKKNEFVEYELEQIKYKDRIYNGCKSRNFLDVGDRIITLERLYQIRIGSSLTNVLNSLITYKEKAEYIVKFVGDYTGLIDFGSYLSKILVIDALFLNEDRHMHNIAVIQKKNGKYDYCPIFDNGASLLSDSEIDYPVFKNTLDLIKNVESKTIGPDFIESVDAVESLYGTNLLFNYSNDDIDEVLDSVDIYDDEIVQRVKQILKYQKQKWNYFFE